jgi:hypothetical protein
MEDMMKNRKKLWGVMLCLLLGFFGIPQLFGAEIDWTTLKQINLDGNPTDIATAEDGSLIFVLTPGEILVFSPLKNTIVNRIPVDKEFDRLTYSSRSNMLVLTGGASKTLRMIRVDRIYDIDISDHPIKGPADAAVTIAVFDDYQ